jgi:hypothetical protein
MLGTQVHHRVSLSDRFYLLELFCICVSYYAFLNYRYETGDHHLLTSLNHVMCFYYRTIKMCLQCDG